jgi:hypothetical protein
MNETEPRGKPSAAYKNIIINGARDVGLPSEYVGYLRSFEDNGHISPIGVELTKEFYVSS